MDYVFMALVLTLTVALAIGIGRALLGSIFWMMAEGGLPFTFYWKRVFFVGALFWMWYFTPGAAESRAATRAIELLVFAPHSSPERTHAGPETR